MTHNRQLGFSNPPSLARRSPDEIEARRNTDTAGDNVVEPPKCTRLARIVSTLIGALLFPLCLAQESNTLPYAASTNPQAAKRAESGEIKVANAAWWGFDAEDATSAIQGAIDSGAQTVIIPYMGQDWIVRPIKLKSHQGIFFEPGVVVMAKKGEFRGKRDALFEAKNVTNVTLRGYGATFRMRKKEYTEPPYTKSEFRHTLSLRSSSNISVLGLTLQSSGGDGISVDPIEDERRVPCRNIEIRDCVCDDNFRQGISVISAEHLRIKNCTITGTRGTAPQAAIDLEPGSARDRLVDIELSDCVTDSNEGTGISVHLGRLTKDSRDVSVRIQNCLVRRSRQPGLRAMLNLRSAPRGFVEFKNCVIEGIIHSGVWGQWNTAAPIKLRFVDCKWQRAARTLVAAPIAFELTGRGKINKTGGIEFVNCYVYDDKKRPALVITDLEKGEGKYQVTGKIHVINPHGDMDDGTTKRCARLEVTYRKIQE